MGLIGPMDRERMDLLAIHRSGIGLSQAQVAALLGVTRQTVHAVERRAIGKIRDAMTTGAEAPGSEGTERRHT